jgi:hypothetical protein
LLIFICRNRVKEGETDAEKSTSHEKCRIVLLGVLEQKWDDWFDGFTIIPQYNHKMLLMGSVTDQAGFLGI